MIKNNVEPVRDEFPRNWMIPYLILTAILVLLGRYIPFGLYFVLGNAWVLLTFGAVPNILKE